MLFRELSMRKNAIWNTLRMEKANWNTFKNEALNILEKLKHFLG